jgi:hypothetical protein
MKSNSLPVIFAALFLAIIAAGPMVAATSPEGASSRTNGSGTGFSRAADADPSRALPAVTTQTAPEFGALPEAAIQRPRSEETGTPSTGFDSRTPLAQSGCTICLTGVGSVSWTGTTGSFHVDGIYNYRASGTSGTLDLRVALWPTAPVFGGTVNYYTFSDVTSFSPLSAGYHYTNVNSGTVNYHPSSIPAGTYFAFLFLREFQSGTLWYYEDFIILNNKVTCNGVGCSTVAACVEDAYTMCLVGGRYQVTSHWKNQYAGGAMANLNKAKLTDATGAFWISDANTFEYLIRFNTSTDNGRAWIAIPTFTDVEFWIDVTDTVGGQSKEYHSAPGNQTLIYDPYFFVYP